MSIRSKIQSLITAANNTTGESDATLTDAVQTLVDGYGQGGGSSITVEPLTVTSNGKQTAPSGKAYSPVTVNVPNSYTNRDIGKVVNGSKRLVAQSDYGIAGVNRVYDTTYNNSITVNVEMRIVYLNDSVNGGTATLANPFDGLDYGSLMDGLDPRTARWDAFISFKFQGMDVLYHPFKAYYAITAMAFLPDDGQGNPIGAFAQWNGNGGLNALYVLSGGQMQDMRSVAANIPCTTIIYGTDAPTPAT